MRPLLLATWLLVPFAAWAQGASTLHARLDLRQPIADGWLDPETETVGLRGGTWPLSWALTQRAEDPDGDGIYETSAAFAVAGDSLSVELKIKVDGIDNPNGGWQEGENHTVVLYPGETTDLGLAWSERAPDIPPLLTGHIEPIGEIEAEGLVPRVVWVWLPPGYEEAPERRYPVLYLHDGQSKIGAYGGQEWGMDETAQALVEAGEIEPLILVAVESTDDRTTEYTPTRMTWERLAPRVAPPTASGRLGAFTGAYLADGDTVRVDVRDGALSIRPPDQPEWFRLEPQEDGTFFIRAAGLSIGFERDGDGPASGLIALQPPRGGNGDAYGRLLTDTLKPMIDARYRTRPEAEFTGIGGSSLGGLISMHLGLTRPDVFGRLIVASPSVWWDDKWILGAVDRADPNPEQRVWIDMGLNEGDSMVPDARELHRRLLARGWAPERVIHVETEGAGHDNAAWAARAPDMLRFLFPPDAE
ncbi:MAG: alpha/beta hydrolase-fold protein [Bacteroidota bacterium]